MSQSAKHRPDQQKIVFKSTDIPVIAIAIETNATELHIKRELP